MSDASLPERRRPSGSSDLSGPFGSARSSGESARVEQARRLAARADGLPSLNRLAELAARLLHTSSAQVSVIADDQTVMGGAGDASSSVGQRSPSADSLCTVTTEAAVPVVIPDATADPRTRDLPSVRSGAVGAYLGVPLHSGDHVVGALCVFSPGERAWTAEEVGLLAELAGPTMTELELAALESTYEEDRVLWQLAVDAAGVGAFDWDLRTDVLRWDERLLELFGHTRESFGGTIEAFNACVHPEDRDRVGLALSSAIESCGGYAAEYRVVRPDGEVRWVSARGHAIAGPDGTAARVVGAAYDTTAVHDGEARVARTLDAMPTAFFHLDRDWRFSYANPEARRLLGAIGSEVVGHVIWELFPDAVGTEFESSYRGAMDSDEPAAFEAYYPPPLDAWYEVRCWPVPDGLSVYFIEVTQRHQARAVLERAARRSELLAEVTRALTATLDEEEAVARLTQILVPGLGDWCVVTLVEGSPPPDPRSERGWRRRLRDIGWWHRDPERRTMVERYAQLRVPALTDDSLVAEALVSQEPVVVPSGATERIVGILRPGEAGQICRDLAPSAVAVLPLQGRGRLSGLMTVFRDAERGSFSEEDLDLLADVAGRAGLALDNANLYAGQRKLAEGLQRSLLTAPPQPADLEVAVRYEPAAESAQVGGDWYDAFEQTDGTLTLVIGDVVGHDTVAAAEMGEVRGLLRGIAATTGDGPAALLERVDRAMETLAVDTIATSVVARLEPSDAGPGWRRLRWANAGHPPPLLLEPGDDGVRTARLLWSTPANRMLGLPTDDESRAESVVDVPPGAVLLLFTDGLVERRGEVLDVGLERLRDTVLATSPDASLEEVADQVLRRQLPGWTEDDVALVVVRLRG
ncbi:SpoIIE family protein phosphatase [Nocardioides zeae]|uniref:SpoIIE family protein phosphatase n=1 Tax=Nocardioides imazamoxiresistens TaxID=3231893 RepID=A0ABU3PS93_9ACTN|nr:SpoIIE family protein phosphatase [Nocardioides zeae]MDT9592100.1 SpoIIE family protein phosphatase [Nocardioides zeae]